MADINVTINPAPSVSATVSAAPEVDVTIGEGIPKHASTHAPGGSDSLEAYYATTGSLAYVSGLTTGIGNTGYLTGYVSKTETGDFYPASNPSGFITGVDLSGYVTGDVVRPSETGDFITNSETGIFVTGSVVRPSETGGFITTSQTGAFYPASNPSNFATQTYVNTASGYLQTQVTSINNQTGNFVLKSATGNFITTSQTGQFVGTGQTGYYTGIFYPYNSNPLGYVQGAVVRPSQTGAFLTTGAADARYYGLADGQSISGYAITGYNDAVTGMTVTGVDTKTITLFQRDGTTLSANFTDNSSSGASDTGYLTGYVSKTETGNIAVGTIGLILDGGGSAITTGYKSFTTTAFSGEILSYTILADRTGSIVIDVWKDSYANYPLTSGDSICSTNKVTLATGIKNTDSTLTSWTKTFAVGDNFGFNVDGVSGVQKISLTLKVKKA